MAQKSTALRRMKFTHPIDNINIDNLEADKVLIVLVLLS